MRLKLKLFPKVNCLGRRTGGNDVRFAKFKYFSVVENVSLVAYSKGFPDIMVRDQHANPFFFQLFDNILNIYNGNGVNAGKRFI